MWKQKISKQRNLLVVNAKHKYAFNAEINGMDILLHALETEIISSKIGPKKKITSDTAPNVKQELKKLKVVIIWLATSVASNGAGFVVELTQEIILLNLIH